ncbi:hypothetical protein MM213_00925 [Belliella sp. R4-6]|uniref:Uncharacterized protein n=1 Tax=Belliella alkalica TaxID=1730871 RepID=A0ABS9V738_9BACT|nr:hypothetical protein [Belliella alkalica]MCH7412029.1 hypothetical protein [Belliella alkalica]
MEIFKSNFKSLELANHVTIENLDLENLQINTSDLSNTYFGSLYSYKIGEFNSSENKVLVSWLSYVVYAGLLKFKFKRSRFKLNLGLNLRDYYQNIKDYLSVKKQKKIRYFNGEKEVSKIYEIVNIEIFPNIYASAYALSKISDKQEFIVLKFGLEDFEGIYFNPALKRENQAYSLGEGLAKHLTEPSYEGPTKVKDAFASKSNLSKDAKIRRQIGEYFKTHIYKKINRLVGSRIDVHIIIIPEVGLSSYVGDIIASSIKGGSTIEIIYHSNALASEGLYLIDEFELYDAFNEKVGVAITNDKTTFTSRKNNQITDELLCISSFTPIAN